jgi:phospholipid/cholesterol/gamma-HCH transport system substrate-binding protein
MKLDIDDKARVAFGIVLLLTAAAGIAWYAFSSSRFATYQIRTRDPVSGLIADAPVEYHGVEVGKVKNIELIDSRSVRILLSIEHSAPVTAATVATITSRGLATRGFTGYVYVALEDVGSDFGRLAARAGERYPEIPAAASKSISLDTAMTQVNENVQFITERLRQVLDDKTIASLKQSTDSLQHITKTLADNNARLNTLIVNGDRISQQLPPLLAASNDTVKALQTQILPQAHKTLTSLDTLSTSLTGLTSKVNKDPSVLVRGALMPQLGPGEGK